MDARQSCSRLFLIIAAVVPFAAPFSVGGVECRGTRDEPDARSPPALPDIEEPRRFEVSDAADYALRSVAWKLRAGVVLLGHPVTIDFAPTTSRQSTGFVISRKERLIATAAHVADDFVMGQKMFAILDGTSFPYRVERVWYHPGLTRRLDHGLEVRSSDPRDGELASWGQDVAVMRLSKEGPELPFELELASEQELRVLERGGQPVGFLGYPGNVDRRWPTPSRPATAAFADACIAEVCPAAMDTLRERQLIWYDYDLGPGSSGSPVFLGNGHVVGIHANGDNSSSSDGTLWSDAFRIDTLQELMRYHGLDEEKPGLSKAEKSRLDWGPDPRLEEARRAAKLVREAVRLRRGGDYGAASTMFNEALQMIPDYTGALLERSKVYLFYLGYHWNELSVEERIRYADWAISDSRRCRELSTELATTWLIHAQCAVFFSCATQLKRVFGMYWSICRTYSIGTGLIIHLRTVSVVLHSTSAVKPISF